MKKTGILACLLTIIWNALLMQATLAQPTGAVKGHVTGNEGVLAGATVTAGAATTQTDNNGDFHLILPPGKYTLTVSYVGHKNVIVYLTVTAGETLTQTLILQPEITTQEVVVVGSRNPKRSATESPVPVDVIPLKQIANQVGQLDVTQLLNLLAPSFNSVRQSLGDGTDHIDPAQLRGLGPDQVLVLVNGKRYHQSSLVNVNGTVNKGTTGTDLNSIPASAIDRIEVLRDGASAQYGSDAIAGVINIVLKKTKGLTFTSSAGENVTTYDKNYSYNRLNPTNQITYDTHKTDGKNFQASLNYGAPLTKGYLNFNAEYLYRGPTTRNGLYTGQVWPTVGGVDKSDSINKAKGLTRDNFDIRVGNTEIKGGSFTVNFGYPVGKNLELYFTGIANAKNGYTFGLYRYPFNFVAGTSSFPSANSGSAAAAAIVSAKYPNGFLPGENSRVRDYHGSLGLRGKLGSWQMDISETFGANSYQYLVSNSVNYTQAYLSGMTAAQLQTDFNSGKTKTWQSVSNIDFSKNHKVLEGLNTAFGAELRLDNYGIEAGELNSYADLTNPANSSSNNTLAGIAGAQVFAGFLPSNAGSWTRTSFGLYSDNELQINNRWLLSGALRYEHFSDFGSTLNYKIATRYKLTRWLSVRGATSSGFRAPSLQQEHYSKVTTSFVTISGVLTPVQAGTFTNDSRIASILGIPSLKQETSTSYSLGATAHITQGFDITVDAYQIDIKNRIILSNTFRGNTSSAAGIALGDALNAAGAATASVFANAINTRSRGIEGVLTYTKSWRKEGITINLAHSSIQNRVRRDDNGNIIIHGSQVLINTGQLSSYFNRADQSRIETYSPQTKDIFTIQYRHQKFSTLLRLSYFGKVSSLADSTGGANIAANAFNNNVKETIDQTYGGKVLTDITLGYAITKSLSVNIGANNFFDVYPDKQQHYNNTSTGRFTYSRAVSQFGFNGRYFFGRVTLSL